MRTALLPTPGDPFMLAYWLRNYATWSEHVDELVVLVNGQDDPDTAAELRAMVEEAGGAFASTPARIGHDGALRWLLENGTSEYVVLCEDDAYVRKPEAVGRAFDRIERGEVDIVGSPRHEDYASSPLQDWPDRLTQDHEEVRRGLWPAFLFARRADLLDTDRMYGDRAWNKGDVIGGLGIRVTPELCEFVGISPDYIHLDTLFGTTFQLRARNPRIELVHRVRLFDAQATEEWVKDDPPWFHVTGLSTLDYILDGRTDIPDHGLWERRIAWWSFIDVFESPERANALAAFVRREGVELAEIDRWTDRFVPWARTLVPA